MFSNMFRLWRLAALSKFKDLGKLPRRRSYSSFRGDRTRKLIIASTAFGFAGVIIFEDYLLYKNLLEKETSIVAAEMERENMDTECIQLVETTSEFHKQSKKTRAALLLAAEIIHYKLTKDDSGHRIPIGENIAALRIAADENDAGFLDSMLSRFPPEAVNKGVFSKEALMEKFENVKNVCKKVALIDENDENSLYFLSYFQSTFRPEAKIENEYELEFKNAWDPYEWDTFDIVPRISYCLKTDNLERALYFANLLQGKPKVIAQNWIRELKLLFETQLAVKALLTYAKGEGVQPYHKYKTM